MTESNREFDIDDYEPVVEALSNIFTNREYARTFVSEAIDLSFAMHPEGYSKLDVASSFNLVTIIIESMFPSSFCRKYFSYKANVLMMITNLQLSSNAIKKRISDLKRKLELIDREISARAEIMKDRGLAKTVESSKNLARQLIDNERKAVGMETTENITEEIADLEHSFENNLSIIVFWRGIMSSIDNYYQGIYHNAEIFDNAIFFEHTLDELIGNLSGNIDRATGNSSDSSEEKLKRKPTPVASQID